MQTIILPGYSPSNLDWAKEIEAGVSLDHPLLIHEWRHWHGGNFSLKTEIERVTEKILGSETNVIAKSVGTRVLMHVAPKTINFLCRVILCGIPTEAENKIIKNLYQTGLSALTPGKTVCYQNRSDPFASYEAISGLFREIAPQIKVVEKQRSDHHYPYFEDFERFLKAS